MSDPAPSDPSGLPARRAALELLGAALARRNGLDEASRSAGFGRLDGRDRAFARALVLATLRHLGPIDRALTARLKKTPPDAVVHILRLGLAQALVLKTPAFAAVGTSVDLAGALKETRPFKGLVNAILRALTRDPPPMDEATSLAPPWLMARWQIAYGHDLAREIAATIALEPETDLSLKDTAPGDLEGRLLPGGTFRTALRGDVATWPGFAHGAWWVQDASAAIPARVLDARPGEAVLDLCAAPGGKTLQLALAGASVVALDRSADRLKRLSENLARMKLEAEVVVADAVTWPDMRVFDAVLLDAPCSATGTFRRHPDVLWAAAPGDIASLVRVQSQLLDASLARLKPGGRLVYCVCSLEPEEGEHQVAALLARRTDVSLVPIDPGKVGAPAAGLRADGTLRILPHHREGGTDGFYIAQLSKAESLVPVTPGG